MRRVKHFNSYFNRYIGAVPVRKKSTLSNLDVRAERNEMFTKALLQQQKLVTRIEKIEVRYKGQPENVTMIMNKNLSTPYNCAMHMNELLTKRSVMALVDGKPWDMHHPLEDNCELQLLHFREPDPTLVNKVFWRSCSFLLGLVVEKAFKEKHFIELHSWPAVNVRSGSFVYDTNLNLLDWSPRQDELRALTVMMSQLRSQSLKFEKLDVGSSYAMKMFQRNRYKLEQIPKILEKNRSSKVTLYRVGDHVDISQGPMISNTDQIGNVSIVSVHKFGTDQNLHRFQGVALPTTLPVNSYLFEQLCNRAKNLNNLFVPDEHPSNVSRAVSATQPT